jgi:hypothetical protein
MPARVSIEARKNADWTHDFQFTANGTSQPINGRLALMVRREAAEATASVTLSSDANGGIVITDAAQGRFRITFDRQKLKSMVPGSYVHDLLYTRTDGLATVIWEGPFTLIEGVTR